MKTIIHDTYSALASSVALFMAAGTQNYKIGSPCFTKQEAGKKQKMTLTFPQKILGKLLVVMPHSTFLSHQLTCDVSVLVICVARRETSLPSTASYGRSPPHLD